MSFALVISVLMVVTGSLNTICAKWADSIKADGVKFNHPFLQATCMFFGEFLCLVAFFLLYAFQRYRWNQANIQGQHGAIVEISSDSEPALPRFNYLVFLPPACCDILATSIMYIGLNLTTASSFQMLRGAVIIFTGLLSVGMLRTTIAPFKWLGMCLVISGLVVVGVSDIYYDDDPMDDRNAIITGNLLIIMAQIIVAIQMVYEQKYLKDYEVPPLLAVGLEGLFGMTILSLLMIPMYYIHVPRTFSTNPDGRLEDVFYALQEIREAPLILVALGGLIFSIAFFNFAGISVTKELSATTRMVLDSVRTLVIWAVSIPLFDEKFIPMQILGFVLLVLGMFVYVDYLIGPLFRNRILPSMNESRLTGPPMNAAKLQQIRRSALRFEESVRKKIVIDYSSPNIAKQFHIGNLRSTLTGRYLDRIHRLAKCDVHSVNYIGDWGQQFALMATYWPSANAFWHTASETDKIKLLRDCYVVANRKIAEEEDFAGSVKEKLTQMEDSVARGDFSSEIMQLWRDIRGMSTSHLKEFYQLFDCKFDEWRYESENVVKGRQIAEELIKKNLIQQSPDGFWAAFFETGEGEEKEVKYDCLLSKESATLYLTREIADIISRDEKYKADSYLYVVDKNQRAHFEGLKRVLRLCGREDLAQKVVHVQFGRVHGLST
ncbi:hypothetical protein WR25_20103, partial [Diploscapter pachys]